MLGGGGHLNALRRIASGGYRERPLNIAIFRSRETFCLNEKRIQNENLRVKHSSAQVCSTANSNLVPVL